MKSDKAADDRAVSITRGRVPNLQEDEMKLRHMVCAVIAGAILAPVAGLAQSGEPGRCPNDSKLLNGGPTLVYGEGPGTWWGLVTEGLDTAFDNNEAAKIAYLNNVFGTQYNSLAELEIYNQDLLSAAWDLNQNGYVCAFELRGTRAYLHDPFVNILNFGVSDDKLTK